MRAVIVGGRSRADFLMGALADLTDEIVAINSDRSFCEYLSSRHDNEVVWGDGTSRSVLEDAGVAGFATPTTWPSARWPGGSWESGVSCASWRIRRTCGCSASWA